MHTNTERENNCKAVVVGGTSGIGLAAALELAARGYAVTVIGRHDPEKPELAFVQSDLRYFDENLFADLSADQAVNVLLLTAGFGRVADFESLHPGEIQALFQVNTLSALQIIRQFYGRLKGQARFYCGILGSIAGLVSSPMFSVYAASKAALCRFTESVNIELEAAGTANRILNVCPGSIPGTGFNGGETDLAGLRPLGREIVDRLFTGETLYIPDYDKVYRGVLERYHADSQAYGLESYQYKKASGRAQNDRPVCVGYLSGTFDLFHIGHLNLFRRARAQCDYLIVGVHNSGSWKGKETFIPFEERMQIVGACQYVDRVVPACLEDSEAWEVHGFDKLFVGSDYQGTERFSHYEVFFADKGVEIVYFPYTQGTSSTQLRAAIKAKNNDP